MPTREEIMLRAIRDELDERMNGIEKGATITLPEIKLPAPVVREQRAPEVHNHLDIAELTDVVARMEATVADAIERMAALTEERQALLGQMIDGLKAVAERPVKVDMPAATPAPAPDTERDDMLLMVLNELRKGIAELGKPREKRAIMENGRVVGVKEVPIL